MRSVIFVVCLSLVAITTAVPTDYEPEPEPECKPLYDLDDARALFEDFIVKYNKIYKDEADKELHFKAYYQSLIEVNKLNSNPEDTATYDINAFSDYTEEERRKMRGLRVPSNKQ